jgi:hypothetical protein
MHGLVVEGGLLDKFKKDTVVGMLLRVALLITLFNLTFSLFPHQLNMLRAVGVYDGPDYSHSRYYWGALFSLSEAALVRQCSSPV